VIRIQHRERLWRDHAPEPTLALHERQLAEILTIQPEDVEGIEIWLAAPEQLAASLAL
jgi:hypothetical protein